MLATTVNAVAWAPHALGHPMLACASSDGDISILSYKGTRRLQPPPPCCFFARLSHLATFTQVLAVSLTIHLRVVGKRGILLPALSDLRWTADRIRSAHKNGVTSVSWAPMLTVGSLGQNTEQQSFPRLVSCGCDNLVKIWTLKNDIWGAEPEATLPNHNAWVRDVAWAPSIGLSCRYAASPLCLDFALLLSVVPHLHRSRGLQRFARHGNATLHRLSVALTLVVSWSPAPSL